MAARRRRRSFTSFDSRQKESILAGRTLIHSIVYIVYGRGIVPRDLEPFLGITYIQTTIVIRPCLLMERDATVITAESRGNEKRSSPLEFFFQNSILSVNLRVSDHVRVIRMMLTL